MNVLASRLFIVATVALSSFAGPASAADGGDAVRGPAGPGTPRFVLPPSSIEQPGDVGRRAHTNYGIVVPQPVTGPGEIVPPRAPN